MEIPVIIAVVMTVIYTIGYILVCIIREWWKMKNDQPRYVNEAERPHVVKPKRRMYRGKAL